MGGRIWEYVKHWILEYDVFKKLDMPFLINMLVLILKNNISIDQEVHFFFFLY